MDEIIQPTPEIEEPSNLNPAPPRSNGEPSIKTWQLVVGILVVVGAIVGIILFLLGQGSEKTALFRDIVIIFMALESLIIGIALVILVVQLAILINLLQNEIKPILNSTNETVNTLKGTATFLSNNLVEPVIKLNEYLAGFSKLLDFFRPRR